MDWTEIRRKGIRDWPAPREVQIETSLGVRGTIAFPHSVDNDDFLAQGYSPPTNRVVLILHGQGGHRDYCYQKKLANQMAAELGVYSLRIDFRGCGASADVADTEVGRVLESDVEDISSVCQYILSEDNATQKRLLLSAIVAHSRGAVAMFLWAVQQERLLRNASTAHKAIVVPNLINCSSRFRSKTVLDRYPVDTNTFDYLEQTALRHGQMRLVRITRQELHSLASADTPSVRELSCKWSVLSIYGTEDEIISKEDCAYFANHLNRGPYTHQLELIDGADHNFYGMQKIEGPSDEAEYNPHGIPLTKKKYINYNYVVNALIIKYLTTEEELMRFKAANDKVSASSRFKNVDGICNFRDMGGWQVLSPTLASQKPKSPSRYYVRPNLLFRCANTAYVTDAGLTALKKLNIKTIFDLRSEQECEKDGVPQNLQEIDVVRVHNPVFKQEDFSPQAIASRYSNLITSWYSFVKIYDHMLECGTDAFREMFLNLRDGKGPILFHCTAGKDRTGIFGMLVLKLAGVDDFTIAKEYELTLIGLKPDHEKIKAGFLARIEHSKSKKEFKMIEEMIASGRKNFSIEEDGFANLISSKSDAMLATLELLRSKYGGILNYMQEHLGFSMQEIQTIFDNIVETEQYAAKF